MTLEKLKSEHKAAAAAAIVTIGMAEAPVFATGPLDDLAAAATSVGTLTGAIATAAVVATGVSVGLRMFNRATGR
jgi:hypothetical protein